MSHIGTSSFTCPTLVQPNPFRIHLQVDACPPRTEFIQSHLNFVAFLLIRHAIRLIFPRPTLRHLHPLAHRPLAIFIFCSEKSRPRENVSQRWFSVFAYFSQRCLTCYRSSTDVSTPPAAISWLCRPVCKTATSLIACSAEDTNTPSVSAVFSVRRLG